MNHSAVNLYNFRALISENVNIFRLRFKILYLEVYTYKEG
jgi:hypothetical protein